MDDTLCQNYFLRPACPAQRQYEALRAVFAQQRPQNQVARDFGYSYDALRQLVRDFRAAIAAGTPPPFSPHNAEAARPRRRRRPSPYAPTPRPSPTPGR